MTSEVPDDALYGAQTQRAVENFPISGVGPHPDFVWATVLVKKAAAAANMRTGRLESRLGEAIVAAADEILAGRKRGSTSSWSTASRPVRARRTT